MIRLCLLLLRRDLVAIIAVLEFNQWFTKLSTKDYKLVSSSRVNEEWLVSWQCSYPASNVLSGSRGSAGTQRTENGHFIRYSIQASWYSGHLVGFGLWVSADLSAVKFFLITSRQPLVLWCLQRELGKKKTWRMVKGNSFSSTKQMGADTRGCGQRCRLKMMLENRSLMHM